MRGRRNDLRCSDLKKIGGKLPKIQIDEEACSGSGDCAKICGEVFEVVSGVSRIAEKYQKGERSKGSVPEEVECVYEAEEKCPFDAIKVG